MVSAFGSGERVLGSSLGWGLWLCSWARHNSDSAPLHPVVQIGTGKSNAGGVYAGDNPAMDWHPIQGGVEILLVASRC